LGNAFGKKKQPGAGKGVRRRFSAQSPGMPNGGYGQYQPKQQPNPMG
jgi:hypothetical protein